MDDELNVSGLNGDFKNFIGYQTNCMINSEDNSFTIIFQKEGSYQEGSNFESLDNVFLPTLVYNYKDVIESCVPNVRILYNNNLTIESLLCGLLIGKIFRGDDDIEEIHELIEIKKDTITCDEELLDELRPLIDEASISDDFDFSKLEDEMYIILESALLKV